MARKKTPLTLRCADFQHIVDAFVQDLSTDVSYSVAIVNQAKAIKHKREMWEKRLKYRALASEGMKVVPKGWPKDPTGWTLDDAIEILKSPPKADKRTGKVNWTALPGVIEVGRKQGRRICPEEKDRIAALARKLRSEGLPYREIADQMGVSDTSIYNWLK